MYLGIDIGGTKTLVASLTSKGVIKTQRKFPTPANYDRFLDDLATNVVNLSTEKWIAGGLGVPGRLDRRTGIALSCGNLGWKNIPIQDDVQKIAKAPVIIENDAKLAGLSEAIAVKDRYQKVLYITISTGIGTALIVNQIIDTAFGDSGGSTIMLERSGQPISWQDLASGKSMVKRFGKQAEDIHDAKTWAIIAQDIGEGLIEVIAITEPEVVIIGGGAGAYLPRFIKPLARALKHYETDMMPIPPIREAKRPNEAVIYGCYELAKATYG